MAATTLRNWSPVPENINNLLYTMIGLKGTLNVIDNSGAIVAECIRVMSGARFARAGNN